MVCILGRIQSALHASIWCMDNSNSHYYSSEYLWMTDAYLSSIIYNLILKSFIREFLNIDYCIISLYMTLVRDKSKLSYLGKNLQLIA